MSDEPENFTLALLRKIDAVMEYHSSQIGRGVLLTEFEERLRRLEEHVGLTPEGH